MNKQELKKYIGKSSLTLAEAMQKIDVNTHGILFLADTDNKLIGCITDGDIRRFLLKGGKIQDSVMDAVNQNPKFAYSEEEASSFGASLY